MVFQWFMLTLIDFLQIKTAVVKIHSNFIIFFQTLDILWRRPVSCMLEFRWVFHFYGFQKHFPYLAITETNQFFQATPCTCLPQYDQCAQNICCLKHKYRSYKVISRRKWNTKRTVSAEHDVQRSASGHRTVDHRYAHECSSEDQEPSRLRKRGKVFQIFCLYICVVNESFNWRRVFWKMESKFTFCF